MEKAISGPVRYIVYQHGKTTISIFSDLHNSKEGVCSSDCDKFISPDNIKYNSESNCVDLPVYLHNSLLKPDSLRDFYFEHPFVVEDNNKYIKNEVDSLDYIDTISVCMRKALKKDKKFSPYMPHGRVHYCDVRDVYYREDKVIKCNPFSGSWAIPIINSFIENYLSYYNNEEFIVDCNIIISQVKFVLDNAKNISQLFFNNISEIKTYSNMPPSWNERLTNIELVTSHYSGITAHRVKKQLDKLDSSTKNLLLSWYDINYQKQLEISFKNFNIWKDKLLYISRIDPKNNEIIKSLYDQIIEYPIIILIPISSLIMDVYVLARYLYQSYNKCSEVYFFAGDAHSSNYHSFFTYVGAQLISKKKGNNINGIRCMSK